MHIISFTRATLVHFQQQSESQQQEVRATRELGSAGSTGPAEETIALRGRSQPSVQHIVGRAEPFAAGATAAAAATAAALQTAQLHVQSVAEVFVTR